MLVLSLSLVAASAWAATPHPAPKCYDLTGKVYADVNGNGKVDNGDGGVYGVTVYAYLSGKTTPYTATTDRYGVYTFHKLPAGTYKVTIYPSKGYALTTSAPVSVKLPSTSITTINFGAARYATICGYIFNDENGNQKWNTGEHGAPGLDLYLYRGILGSVITSDKMTRVVSDKNGYYSFTGLLPGTYTVLAMNGADIPCTTKDTVTVTVTSGQTLNLYKTYGLFGVIYSHP